MAQSRRNWTQAKFERFLEEGRGHGSGKDYKPWLQMEDIASKGRVTRILGWKTHRQHFFASDHETRLFYLFEWSDSIIDIREQYPLLALDLAISIADEMGIKYPRFNNTNYVLTTDFMLTVNQNGKHIQFARTFKESAELSKKRVAEKLELERQYYLRQNIDWGIITEKEVPRQLADNIKWIHSDYKLEATAERSVEEMQYIGTILKSRLKNSNETVNKITCKLDNEMHLESGTSMDVFRHLLARKEVIIDMLSNKVSSFTSAREIQNIIE